MTQPAKRKVNRSGSGGRAGIVREYDTRAWYDLPSWAAQWVVDYAGWFAVAAAVLLAPAVLLATVLGASALPLDLIGLPIAASDNSIGIAAAALIAEFILIALSIRPLLRQKRFGLNVLLATAILRFVHGVILQHAITGGIILLLAAYIYWQVRAKFE